MPPRHKQAAARRTTVPAQLHLPARPPARCYGSWEWVATASIHALTVWAQVRVCVSGRVTTAVCCIVVLVTARIRMLPGLATSRTAGAVIGNRCHLHTICCTALA